MTKRDDMLNKFLTNPLTLEICNLTAEELSNVSFSTKTNDPVIDALKRMIISSVEEQSPTSTIKAVNTVLKSYS
ncbi:hypothetical protein [Nitrincola alkalilacustris]|uniref:hypothetical protein n=1 Tax=Nitrincola alkalilacustris TaxID=1571224 RepID=UPI00124C43D8|nr:hypothetical protein [Nitrincola alkalilacustris]